MVMMRYFLLILLLPLAVNTSFAQNEDDFLPQVSMLPIDSTEDVVLRFCKDIITAVPEYRPAFTDKEDVMFSKYIYDNGNFETLKMSFQFKIVNVVVVTDTLGNTEEVKKRVVRLMKINGELNTVTEIYNYLFNTGYTPDKIMAISNKDKLVSYNGSTFSSSVVADDFKPGYWIITFYKM